MSRSALILVLSCEHGGNLIPARYAPLFARAARVLRTHRGFDPGALDLARALQRRFRAPLVFSTTSRLLVDLNRSLHNPAVFSRYLRGLDRRERERVIERYYRPHRGAIERLVEAGLRGRRGVLHVAVHSFTPVLRGERRGTELGLLYDPARRAERALCAGLLADLRRHDPSLRVHRNRPYPGAADSVATELRRRYPEGRYLGIEVEANQRLARSPAGRARLLRALIPALGRQLVS